MPCITTPVDLCDLGKLPYTMSAAAINTALPYLTGLACVAEPGCHVNMVCLSGTSCCPGRHVYYRVPPLLQEGQQARNDPCWSSPHLHNAVLHSESRLV